MRFRVYIKPFDSDGVYLDNYIEVTEDVVSIGDIKTRTDNTEYDVGTLQNGGFNIVLRNDKAKYSDALNLRSIFRTKRNESLVKVTYDFRDYNINCGFFYCGEEVVTEEFEIFEGLIEDLPSTSDIGEQEYQFKVLGLEALLDKTGVSFLTILSVNLISDIMFTILNQSKITNLLTVDASNINLPNDFEVDFKSPLRFTTVREALEKMLFITNSIFYVRNRVCYIVSRDASIDLKYTFYGAGSNRGLENILDIKKYREGLNRTFNLWTWKDTELSARYVESIDVYGEIKKEMSSSIIDVLSIAKIQSSLNANLAEFQIPKAEMELYAPLNYETLNLNILDKIRIDYPNIYESSNSEPLPRYGQEKYGQVIYPFGQYSLTVPFTNRYKIIGKKISPIKGEVIFDIRRI